MKRTSPSSRLVRMAARSPARSMAGPDVELVGDDVGERGLAETRRTGEQEVIGRLSSLASGFEDDREPLLQLGLADELGQPARPEAGLLRLVVAGQGLWGEEFFAHRR